MSLAIVHHDVSGRTMFATLTQLSSSGVLGDVWNVTSTQWATNPPTADRKITLTEGTSPNLGRYSGGISYSLQTYTGRAVVSIHDDDDADIVYGSAEVYISGGAEVRNASTADADTGAEIYSYVEGQGGFTSSNMRGTDSAMLAASYTAPDNTGIGNAVTQATAAASSASTAATQSTSAATNATTLVSRLTDARATKLDNLDAAITTRSSHSALAVHTAFEGQGGVTSSNMRGTDSALLAASYTAPNNSGITTASTAAQAAQTAAESVDGKLTATRAGYIDNLSGGAVATQASVNVIQNTTRTKFFGPAEQQIPSAGSTTIRFNLMLFDSQGNMEAPDSLPTVTAANAAGTDRSANLGTVTLVGTGHYRVDYTISSSHLEEQITLTASIVEGSSTIKDAAVVNVVSLIVGSGFTSTDRTKLDAMYNKLPSKSYLVGTAASDGDINLDQLDGDKGAFKADVSALATSASITALPANVHTYINANGGVTSSNMRGTDSALLAASYTAPDNTGIGNAVTQATAAASSASTAATQSTNAAADAATIEARLTAARATNLDNLDTTISSRSDFDETTDDVTLAAGQGLATAATQAVIQAKTDLIPADPVDTSDLVSAAAIASQVNTTLVSSHGDGAWNTASDATLAQQNAILAAVGAIGGVLTPSSVVDVSPSRTWVFDDGSEDALAANIVMVSAGSTVTLAMDFAGVLNPGTAILTVASADDVSGNALETTDLAPSQDQQKAHFKVSPTVAGLRHEMQVTVTTSDGQTLVRNGILRVE